MATWAKPKLLATSRQTRPKVQCIVPTTIDNLSRVIQTAIELLRVKGISQVLPSADITLLMPRGSYHLFLLRGGWWHPLWVVSCQILFYQFFHCSILMATIFFPLVGPGKAATIWGFSRANLLTGAVTMSLGVTPVASKFSLPIEAVTVNTHHLSPSVWLDGVRGPASSMTNLVVETTWVSILVELVAWPVSMSFGVSTSDLVKKTHGISSWWSFCSARKSILDINLGRWGGGFSWWGLLLGWTSEWWRGGVMCSQGFQRAWHHVSDLGCGGQGNGVPLGGPHVLA